MEVICLHEEAFYALLDKAYAYLDQKREASPNKWITPDEAMKRLNITSRTTLQKFRDEGRIRFSQPEKKIILYDPQSIDDYLDKHAKDTF